MWALAIPIIAAAAGAWFNNRSQRQQNERNQGFAEAQIAHQTNMSNTAHQREVQDLKASGLNPYLTTSGNGAGTPGAVTPDTSAPQLQMPEIFSMIQGMQNMDLAKKDYELRKSQTAAGIAKTMSDTDLNKMKKILAQKGLIRADLEGEGAGMLQKWIKEMKDSWKHNRAPTDRELKINNQSPWNGIIGRE